MPDSDEPKDLNNDPEVNDSITPRSNTNDDESSPSEDNNNASDDTATDHPDNSDDTESSGDGEIEEAASSTSDDEPETSEAESSSKTDDTPLDEDEPNGAHDETDQASDSASDETSETTDEPKKPFDVAAAEEEESVAVNLPKSQVAEDGGAAVFAQSSHPTNHDNDVEWPPKPASEQTAPNPAASQHSEFVQPATSVAGDGEQHMDVSANAMPSGGGKKRLSKKLWLGALLVVIIILLACGYVFGVYLPNQPSAMYQSGLENSGKAVDQLVDYAKQEDSASYKSASFNGQINYSGGSVNGDVSFSGKVDQKSNSDIKLNGDIMGEKIGVNVKTIQAKNTLAPDLYFQVNGVKKMLDTYGMNSIDHLDGQWLEVDHTLISSLLSQQTDTAGSLDATKFPTTTELNDVLSKVQSVNKQYLFTTDSSKAVLTHPDFVGKETVNGRTEYHYKVGYNKAHLQAYISAEKKALDSGSLNDWSKKANGGKSLSQAMDFQSLEKSVKNAPANYKFDLWVDKDTRLVSKVQFTDPKHADNEFTLSQNYTGGDTYPLELSIKEKDDHGNPTNGSLAININSNTHKISLKADIDGTSYSDGSSFGVGGDAAGKSTGTGKINLTFSITPSKDYVKVTAPKGAESINDVISELLGGSVSELQQSAKATQMKADASAVLSAANTFVNNHNGALPTKIVQKGTEYALCATKCDTVKGDMIALTAAEKLLLSGTAPKSNNAMVLAIGKKCSGSNLVAGNKRDMAVAFRSDSKPYCVAS